jgi:erythronate-4-phosphate dehydrogenase
MLRILADANIPHARALFGPFGEVEVRPGAALDAGTVAGAHVLLVRSVTVVDADLLRGSRVRFVGSATIGTDHVDLDFLAREGIAFAHAPGSNAESVVEYVLAALLAVLAARGEALRGRTAGVVGCGAIGGRLARRLPALGAEVLRNDPPLAEAAGVQSGYHPLGAVLDRADILTLHPPLTRTGPHPTHHLIGARELAALRPGALLVNASRGAVVDNPALREALGAGRLGGAVLDVWEGEPSPDPALLERCTLGTPHIAGYSYDGKVEGARMLASALAAWLRQEPAAVSLPEPEALPPLQAPPSDLPETAWLDALTRQAYDIRADDARMRNLLALPPSEQGGAFQHLRKTYPVRRTFGLHRVGGEVPPAYRRAIREGLGFR